MLMGTTHTSCNANSEEAGTMDDEDDVVEDGLLVDRVYSGLKDGHAGRETVEDWSNKPEGNAASTTQFNMPSLGARMRPLRDRPPGQTNMTTEANQEMRLCLWCVFRPLHTHHAPSIKNSTQWP